MLFCWVSLASLGLVGVFCFVFVCISIMFIFFDLMECIVYRFVWFNSMQLDVGLFGFCHVVPLLCVRYVVGCIALFGFYHVDPLSGVRYVVECEVCSWV